MASSSNNESCSIKQLLTNPKNVFLDCAKIILKYCEKIIENPDNPKYRKIRIGNAIVQDKLLSVYGAMECLFEMGFEEDGEFLLFPDKSIQQLQIIRDKLIKEVEQLNDTTRKTVINEQATTIEKEAMEKTTSFSQPSANILISEQNFYRELLFYHQMANYHENISIQKKAQQVLPMKDLETAAFKRLADVCLEDKTTVLDFKDCLLIELLDWFKTKFFTWVNRLPCTVCGGETIPKKDTFVTVEEGKWGASRVECYYCDKCKREERFPRYNNPLKLLETRRGRCGEWANCFTLCCRALDFDARFVCNWQDHVWTEVYSNSQKRWLHCDACENICDQPLIYEIGWKIKPAYIIAFSKEEIVDVTWRYSKDHRELIKNRTLVRPEWLSSILATLNNKFQSSLPKERLEYLHKRMISEFVDLLTPRNVTEGDYSGRTSGSLLWRISRGETSIASAQGYVLCLTEREKKSKLFHVKYTCASDKYVRISDNNCVTNNWSSCCVEAIKIKRKIESDWNMVYLARHEGCDQASISWKFNFENFVVDKAEIKVCSTTFESGIVQWILKMEDKELPLKENEMAHVSAISGHSDFIIQANLKGGNGTTAWQHSQIFRQPCNSEDYPFEVLVTFK